MAIVTEKRPEKVNALLAYMHLPIREAQGYRGKGWVIYNHIFQFIAATHETTDWVQLDPSLLASFLTRQQ